MMFPLKIVAWRGPGHGLKQTWRLLQFCGLRQFKGRFVPSWWESEYALHQRGSPIPPRVGHRDRPRPGAGRAILNLLTRHALKYFVAIPGVGDSIQSW
jgi:hypothetical protein